MAPINQLLRTLLARTLVSGDPSTPRSKSVPAAVAIGIGVAIPVGVLMMFCLWRCAKKGRKLRAAEEVVGKEKEK
ncbi:MAG: hypothetical protein Q9170_007062, partial [Blastenia crenularia]